jgi:hypothetical protein
MGGENIFFKGITLICFKITKATTEKRGRVKFMGLNYKHLK